MKASSFYLLFLTCYISFSQVTYEKGYFINSSNKKIECLIKNEDKKDNPSVFSYKLSNKDSPKLIDTNSAKEVVIYNSSKYIKSNVEIDKSDDLNISFDSNKYANYVWETLFLKVLVEGKASLFSYQKGSLKKYFYQTEKLEVGSYEEKFQNNIKEKVNKYAPNINETDLQNISKEVRNEAYSGKKIKQLFYKKYYTKSNKLAENNQYKQQLLNNLECDNTINLEKLKNIKYHKKDLIKIFVDYNKCSNSNYNLTNVKSTKTKINFNIRPGINSSSLNIKKTVFPFNENFNIENTIGYRLGIEAEIVFNFNKNKWSVFAEPTYQSYKAEGINEIKASPVVTIDRKVEVDYNSIEVPIGFRYYMFLNEKSKLFISTFINIDLPLNSTIKIENRDVLNINSSPNFGLGLGYKLHDKYSLELRYNASRNLLDKSVFNNANFSSFSAIIGYSLF